MLSSEAAVQQYWDQSRSLLLFRGVLSSDAHDNFFAQSRIYLGSLRGDPLHPSVAVRLPIHSDDFPTTSDTHSLIVYYALAKDAQRIGDDRAHIIELLSRAQDKISDLKKQSPLAPNLVGIEKDIKHCLLVARGVAANP